MWGDHMASHGNKAKKKKGVGVGQNLKKGGR